MVNQKQKSRVAKSTPARKPAKKATKSAAQKSYYAAKTVSRPVKKSSKSKKCAKTPVYKVTLGIIIVSAIAVLVCVFFCIFFKPETAAHRELEKLAKAYYEDYYYDTLTENVSSDSLVKYAETGLPVVRLRHLFLFDNQRYASSEKYFNQSGYVCDETATYVKYYPIAPYGIKDYRVEYNYSCTDA